MSLLINPYAEQFDQAVRTAPLYEYAPGTGVYVRDERAIQFGLDATRMGVIEIPNPKVLAANLELLTMPATREEWCAATGLDPLAAASLFEDLLAFGTIRPLGPQRSLGVIGTSSLARCFKELCTREGIKAYAPGAGEPHADFLRSLDTQLPVFIFDQLGHSIELARALRSAGTESWVQVSALDNRALIGPIHLNHEGPCPVCFDLIRADSDPCWPVVVKQSGETSTPPEAATTNIMAGYAALVAFRILGIPGPPGASNGRYLPGELYEIDPYGKDQQRIFSKHHLCPECLEA